MTSSPFKMPVASHSAFGHKLLGLQMLRGGAAIMVVYAHLTERIVLRGFARESDWWLTPDIGQFGVCLFFAISGFVIIHSNRAYFGALESRKNVAIFLKKRAIRIYPLYSITTFIMIIFTYFIKNHIDSIKYIIKSLLFIPYRNDSGIYHPTYELGWSLNYEIFFYLIVALGLFFSFRLAIIMIFSIIAILIFVGFNINGQMEGNFVSQLIWFYTRPVMAYFLAGVAARALPFHAFERHLAKYAVIVIILTLLAAYLAYCSRTVEWLSAIFIFCVVRAAAGHVSYARLWRPARESIEFLGDSSYSLYLTHSFVLGAVTLAIARLVHVAAMAVITSLVMGFAVALLMAAVVFRYVEQPGVRFFKNRFVN